MWFPGASADEHGEGVKSIDAVFCGGREAAAEGRLDHPGAQLRFTDTDGLRLTAFITNTRGRQLADEEFPTHLKVATGTIIKPPGW